MYVLTRADGHTVGNHTYHHPDMSKISDKESFQKEMDAVAKLYGEVTGKEISMYYRPPQGKYSTENLQMAKELGYTTFFWSLAYVDWNQDSQPSHEQAFDKLLKRQQRRKDNKISLINVNTGIPSCQTICYPYRRDSI